MGEATTRRRRVSICLLAALALHLLGMIAHQRWATERVGDEIPLPVRYEPMAIERERFYPVPPNLLAEIAAERPSEEVEPLALPELADVPPPPELELWELGDLEMPGEGGEISKAFGTREDSLPGLEELQLETVRMRAEELAAYARLWTPDADVTDAASRDRQLGRQIVLAAVEAMGGMEALLEIRDMRYQGRYHKSYGPRSRYAHMLPGGARLIYDGQRGWVDLFGEPYPLEGKSFREVQRRAERWDFLSRYLGSGIRLTYLGTRRPLRGGPARHIVQVEDLKYGGSFRAHFEKDSKLLVTDEYDDKRGPYLHINYQDYGSTKQAFVWQTIERHLLRVMRFARSQYPVSYRDIPDSLFIIVKPDTSWVRIETHKSEATLWVEVQMTNAGVAGKPVLPGGTGRLTGWQKEMLAEQIHRSATADLRRLGTFRKVMAGRHTESRTDLAEGDFLLRIIVYSEVGRRRGASPPIYQAQLFEVTSLHHLMQDGPPSTEYTRTHPECSKYGFGAYTIDESGVYGSQQKISTLIRSTSMKVADSINAYREGPREYLRHADDCCYCKEP